MLVLGQHIQEFQFPVLAHLLSDSATSFDLVFPLFVSGIDHPMLSPFMLSVFHSFVLLYSSYQSLFLVVTFQLLKVFCCCLQHNQRG